MKNYIKNLREKSNFTQEEIAQKIGVSRPTYMQIEKGEKDLELAQAKKLSALFGVPLHDFIEQKEPAEYFVEIVEEKNRKEKEPEFRISIPRENAEKFKNILLYILKKVGFKPNVGQTVIYKLLYFIDFDYYEKFEEQLIGAKYIKNHFGPTPVMSAKIIEEMKKDDLIDEVKSKFFDREQKKFIANPDINPDLSGLSARDIKHIDDELARLSDKTAKELSDLSHKDVPWIAAEEGKVIDYESVFYRTADTSVREYTDEL
jgi:DNA-binding XRE family transcriptional regulator